MCAVHRTWLDREKWTGSWKVKSPRNAPNTARSSSVSSTRYIPTLRNGSVSFESFLCIFVRVSCCSFTKWCPRKPFEFSSNLKRSTLRSKVSAAKEDSEVILGSSFGTFSCRLLRYCVSAVIDLNGRYFGGRLLSVSFYNLDKFRDLDLADSVDPPT